MTYSSSFCIMGIKEKNHYFVFICGPCLTSKVNKIADFKNNIYFFLIFLKPQKIDISGKLANCFLVRVCVSFLNSLQIGTYHIKKYCWTLVCWTEYSKTWLQFIHLQWFHTYRDFILIPSNHILKTYQKWITFIMNHNCPLLAIPFKHILL